METNEAKIIENLKCVKDNIANACLRSRRNPDEVTLVAVTKTVDVDAIKVLLEQGQKNFGESRVQQLLDRYNTVKNTLQQGKIYPESYYLDPSTDNASKEPRWHMIGHLQRNKVKHILGKVEYIHSVDTLRLAEEINTSAARLGISEKVNIFLEVNTSNEKQKYGMPAGAVLAVAEQVETLPNLRIIGLMTMAPFTDNQEICRRCFVRLRELLEEMRGEGVVGPYCRELSMGMSNDYITAVEEGATMVRVGTALFK